MVVQGYHQGECSIQDGSDCHFENEAYYEIINILSRFKCDTSGLIKFGSESSLVGPFNSHDTRNLIQDGCHFLKIAIDIVI